MPHPIVKRGAIYKVSPAHNACIPDDDPFAGRLTPRDWALGLGQGKYLLLAVDGYRITGLESYVFTAKPLGRPVRWAPTAREVLLLQAGHTIEAPVVLATLLSE
jgi:hypothetical protein